MTTTLITPNRKAFYRSSTQTSQMTATKSVAFLLDTPTNQSKALLKSTKPAKSSTLNRFSVFDKTVSCRILFDTTERTKGKRSRSHERNASIERDFLNISDAFQYRSQGLLEEDDLILNITSPKTMQLKELDQSTMTQQRGNANKTKKQNIVMVKSRPKMRRRSDVSIWSGGESDLERKIVFLTFEYIAKPLDFQAGSSMIKGLVADTPSRDTPSRGTPSAKSLTSFKDGSPHGMSGLTRKLLAQSRIVQNIQNVQNPKIVIVGAQDKDKDKDGKAEKVEKLKGKESPRSLWPDVITKESEVFGEKSDKFRLDNEDNNENLSRSRLGDDDKLLQKYLTMSKDSMTKSNDVSEAEISKDNTPVAKRSKSPGGRDQRIWNKRFTVVKEGRQGSPKPVSPPKKDGPHIQLNLNYFQPNRTGRFNFTMSVKANSMLKDPINFGGIRESVSIPKIYRRDLSTGSIQVKGTPTDNEAMYGFTTRLKLLQDATRESCDIGSQTPQNNRMNKAGGLFIRKHQTLVNKIHGHGRSTSSLSGAIEPATAGVKEEKKVVAMTSRIEKRTVSSGMDIQGYSRQLPRLESHYGSVKRRSGKNSQERSQNRSSMEMARKTKGDFKTLINAEEMENNFIKSLRAEKAGTGKGKLGKFKPKITGNKQVLKNYGLVK